MGRLWVSDSIHLRNLAWNLRLACRTRRYGDRRYCSMGVISSPAATRFCGGQEFCGLEPFRHFGPYRGREYRGAGPAARSQSLWSCLNGSHDTAAAGAGSDIFGANILDAALDCAVPSTTSRQIKQRAPHAGVTHRSESPLGGDAPPLQARTCPKESAPSRVIRETEGRDRFRRRSTDVLVSILRS